MADEQPKPEQTAEKVRKQPQGFSSLEIADQVDQTMEMISRGFAPWQIRRKLSEDWGLETRTAERRIKVARERLALELCGMDRANKVAEIVAAMTSVAQFSIENSRGSDAIGAARLISELLSLSPKN